MLDVVLFVVGMCTYFTLSDWAQRKWPEPIDDHIDEDELRVEEYEA